MKQNRNELRYHKAAPNNGHRIERNMKFESFHQRSLTVSKAMRRLNGGS
jgi:hypothetical protein